MFELIELHKRTWGRNLYDLGTTMAMAFTDPPALKKLLPGTEIDLDSIPAMLKAPKKKVTNDG